MKTRSKFEHNEDKDYFKRRLCATGESLKKYKCLFDFRDPAIKRKEFNKIRKEVLEDFISQHGERCFLRYRGICDINSEVTLDHIIPLKTNQLNKEIRGLKAVKGKKIESQSLGSNNLKNLLLTCVKCNAHKKHKILERKKLRALMKLKFQT